jgi:hypothetical protein
MLLLSISAASVLAGEVTGKGKPTAGVANANSICVFSGQNDDPLGLNPENGPPGRTQSFGQDVRKGFIDPRVFNPGDACRGGSNFARQK